MDAGVVVGVFEEAEVERAGLAGGITCVDVGVDVVADADVDGGAGVGVGRGFDAAAVAAVAVGAVYCCPSSPGAKVKVEQNPSEELIIRVRPSFDLFR